MKRRKRPNRLLTLVGYLLVFFIGMLVFSSCTAKPTKTTLNMDGIQTVTVVVSHGYKPSQIEAQADHPLRVEFIRKEEPNTESCDEELVIPSENVKLHLPVNESQIVEIKPQPAGSKVEFQCGMNMMKGTITFQ